MVVLQCIGSPYQKRSLSTDREAQLVILWDSAHHLHHPTPINFHTGISKNPVITSDLVM